MWAVAIQPVILQPVARSRKAAWLLRAVVHIGTQPLENYETYKLRLPHQLPITQCVIWGEGRVYSFANSLHHPINTEHTHRGITPFLPYPFPAPACCPGAIHIEQGQWYPITSCGYICPHYTTVCCYNAPINFPFDILRAIYKSSKPSCVPSLMLSKAVVCWVALFRTTKQAHFPALLHWPHLSHGPKGREITIFFSNKCSCLWDFATFKDTNWEQQFYSSVCLSDWIELMGFMWKSVNNPFMF